MVWGNFFGKNLLDFGGVWTLARMVWGTFFRDELPQSARLSAGGVQSLKGQCPNAFGNFFGGASLNLQTKDINNLIILKRVNMSTVDKFSQYIGDEYPFMEMLWHLEIIYTHL